MSPFDVIWWIIALPPALWEVYAILNRVDGDTLSERTRVWWHVSTVPGKATFGLAWVGFAAWFLWHVVA